MTAVSYVLLALSGDGDAGIVASALKEERFDTVFVHEGLQAVEHLQAHVRVDHVRLVLLEELIGGLPGVDVTRRIRVVSAVPIIMLPEHDDEDTIVEALDAGADDYLSQPVSSHELVARIRPILRRFESPNIGDRHPCRPALSPSTSTSTQSYSTPVPRSWAMQRIPAIAKSGPSISA